MQTLRAANGEDMVQLDFQHQGVSLRLTYREAIGIEEALRTVMAAPLGAGPPGNTGEEPASRTGRWTVLWRPSSSRRRRIPTRGL